MLRRVERGQLPHFQMQLLQSELIIAEAHEAAHTAATNGDDSANDLLVSNVLRRNELQVWFVSEQLAGEKNYVS